VLGQILENLPKANHPDLLVGVNTIDDAGVFRLSDDLALVQTVDFFTPIVDDPYTYGAIAAANSLSDIYAMGGEPVTAMNIFCVPKNSLEPSFLSEILRGGHDKVEEAGCVIVGGHTVEAREMKYGLSVTGKINPDRILTTANAQPGDALVLTKPLGTGIITTAFKLGTVSEEQYQAVTESMLMLNSTASKLAIQYGANACTDITGFSLLGHSWTMAKESGVGLVFYSAAIPTFTGVEEFAAQGYLTGGGANNREYTKDHILIDEQITEDLIQVLYDPQTSGGLLISISDEVAEGFVDDLRSQGVEFAQKIGRVTKEHPGQIIVSND